MENQLSRRENERKTREAEIVNAALRIFCEKGYADASMDEIAKTAHFTKRTVYQYFINKEDLYFAVALQELRRFFNCVETTVDGGANGFEKLRLSGLAYYQFFKDCPDLLRILSNAQFIQSNRESSRHYQEIARLRKEMIFKAAQLIEEGKADGSIRGDLDAKQGAYAIFTLLIGFFFRMVERGGQAVLEQAGLEQDGFILYTLEMISEMYRAK